MSGPEKAEKFLVELEERRPKVLSEKARAFAESLAKDKDKAQAFLQRAGILGEDGQYTEHYRDNSD